MSYLVGTTRIKARDIKAGMEIVCPNTGRVRRAVTDARPCKARGYVRAETDAPGDPVNIHGDFEIWVKVS